MSEGGRGEGRAGEEVKEGGAGLCGVCTGKVFINIPQVLPLDFVHNPME